MKIERFRIVQKFVDLPSFVYNFQWTSMALNVCTRRLLCFIAAVACLMADIGCMGWGFMFSYRGEPVPNDHLYPLFKGLFLPLVGLSWYFLSPVHSKLIYVYIVFGTIGDVFLLSSTVWVYVIGGAFFLVGHVLMSIHWDIQWRKLRWYQWLMLIPDLALVGIFLVPVLRTFNSKAIVFAVYAGFLEIGACSSVARIQNTKFFSLTYILGIVGYVFFLISDIVLLKNEMENPGKDMRPATMSTYIVAQCLILLADACDPRHTQKEKRT